MTEPSASIDDLLGDDEGEVAAPVAARRRSGVAGWVWTLLSAAGFTAVTIVGLRLYGVGVSPVAVYAAILALLLVRRVAAGVAPPRTRVAALRPSDAGEPDGPTEPDALHTAVNRWESALTQAQGNRDRFAATVRPVIGELADERLRQRHGLTRASDPRRARHLLGDPLWNFLESPPAKRPPAPRDLAAIVAELEKI